MYLEVVILQFLMVELATLIPQLAAAELLIL